DHLEPRPRAASPQLPAAIEDLVPMLRLIPSNLYRVLHRLPDQVAVRPHHRMLSEDVTEPTRIRQDNGPPPPIATLPENSHPASLVGGYTHRHWRVPM